MVTRGELLRGAKRVGRAAAAKLVGRNWGGHAPVASDHPGYFRVYFRQNLHLLEVFSFGLLYRPSKRGGWSTLARMNGAHGEHRNPDGAKMLGPHFHIWLEELLEASPVPDDDPRTAVPLDESFLGVDAAWTLFSRALSIEYDAADIRRLTRNAAPLAGGQVELDFHVRGDGDDHDDDP